MADPLQHADDAQSIALSGPFGEYIAGLVRTARRDPEAQRNGTLLPVELTEQTRDMAMRAFKGLGYDLKEFLQHEEGLPKARRDPLDKALLTIAVLSTRVPLQADSLPPVQFAVGMNPAQRAAVPYAAALEYACFQTAESIGLGHTKAQVRDGRVSAARLTMQSQMAQQTEKSSSVA